MQPDAQSSNGRQPLLALGVIALIFAGSLPVSAEDEPVDTAIVKLEANMHMQQRALAGTKIPAAVEVKNQEPFPVAVEVIPKVTTPEPCTLSGVSIQSGGELFENTYLLMASGDRRLEKEVSALDLGDAFEPSAAIPADELHLTLTLSVLEEPGTECRAEALITAVDPHVQSMVLGASAIVLAAVNPVVLGYMEGTGGPIDDDEITYHSQFNVLGVAHTALPTQTVYGIGGRATTLYAGFASFDDGPDTKDRGIFTIRNGDLEGKPVLDQATAIVAEPDHGIVTLLAMEELTIRDNPHTRCYRGVYVDGGIWDSNDHEAEKCIKVKTVAIGSAADIEMDQHVIDSLIRDLLGQDLDILGEPASSIAELLSSKGPVQFRTPTGGLLYVDAAVYEQLVS